MALLDARVNGRELPFMGDKTINKGNRINGYCPPIDARCVKYVARNLMGTSSVLSLSLSLSYLVNILLIAFHPVSHIPISFIPIAVRFI